ncbi:MAG: hypothetical protein ACRDI1_00640 [Actinomycetota bacterium]
MSEPEAVRPKKRRGWIVWVVLIVAALVPIPYQGVWMPAIFVLFELANNLLPENF